MAYPCLKPLNSWFTDFEVLVVLLVLLVVLVVLVTPNANRALRIAPFLQGFAEIDLNKPET